MSGCKLIFTFPLVMVAACATPLKDRVDRLWNARVTDDCANVQRYQDPRSPEGIHREQFIEFCKNREPFLYKSYDIADIQIDRDWGWVDVKYSSLIRGHENVPARESTLNERWHRHEKEWYLVPKPEIDRMPVSPKLRNMKEEPKLRARFLESWSARKAEDWARLFELVDPRDRETIPLKEYSEAEQRFVYLDADMKWAEVVSDKGRVLVDYTAKLRDIRNINEKVVPEFENWINVNGEWYRDIKREEK